MLLLSVIYLAFISLGLPDTVLGSAWPSINQSLATDLQYAGAISMTISASTVISCLLANRLLKQFGTAPLVTVSVLMTAIALFGIAHADTLLIMMLLAIPLGLGAGAIDVALNHFVAQHYPAKHMNYLHSFWGVGATAGPFIMASFVIEPEGWRSAYMALAILQCIVAGILLLSLPLWRKPSTPQQQRASEASSAFLSNQEALKQKGVKHQLTLFWCYCALEASAGLWIASYLITEKNSSISQAALGTAVFYLAITLGRLLCGIGSQVLKEAVQIRLGAVTLLIGTIGLWTQANEVGAFISILLMGFGCAPIFPNTLHLTPVRFGQSASQAVISLSMATAYTATTLVPALIGVIVGALSLALFPILLITLSALILWATETLPPISAPPQSLTPCEQSAKDKPLVKNARR